MTQLRKPAIVKVVQQALEERTPPQPDDFDFVETWPKDAKKTEQQPSTTE